MILVDTSVWADHLRANDPTLANLLNNGRVLTHPFVIGEVALGYLRQRSLALTELDDLPQTVVATDREVRHLIDHHALFGTDIGYVDAHLLASVRLTSGTGLWTRDKRLSAVANQLGLAIVP